MIDKDILPFHLKTAREMLPNVPQDMFDMFFVTLIEDVGWPFENKSDDATWTDWQRVFNPFTLSQIVEFSWNRREFIFDRGMFWEESFGDVNTVVQNYFGCILRIGNYDYYRCRSSTEFHFKKLLDGNEFDRPIVLAPVAGSEKYKILDGNHRMAAALLYDSIVHRAVNFTAWVAV